MAKKHKRFVSIVCIVLALLMIFSVLISVIGSVHAVSQSEIDALKEKRSSLNSEMEGIQSQINDLESQKSSVLDLKAALDEKIALNQQDIDLTQNEIDYYNALLVEQEAAIAEAQQKVDDQYERYCTRIRSMEENGVSSYFGVLFQADSFSNFLTNLDYIYEIVAYDKELEQSYIDAKEALEEVKAEYEATLSELDTKKTELEEKQANLEQETEEAYTMILNLENDIDAYTAAYEENEAAEAQLQSQIDAAVAELEKQQAAAAAAAEAAKNNNSGSSSSDNTVTPSNTSEDPTPSGSFLWPCPASHNVTSPFGYRTHPIFGTTKYHAGIDIAAGSGSAVLAADGGTVVTSTYSSSYGNYIVINHGNGYSTTYAHMSSLLVSAGSTVSQGTTIGLVGSTGWSTGPHLHFEVSYNGSRVNPLNYVS
ncbi:MAG: murein hydrolase activator EnvC family protein [Oscillospiraceae bacterium]